MSRSLGGVLLAGALFGGGCTSAESSPVLDGGAPGAPAGAGSASGAPGGDGTSAGAGGRAAGGAGASNTAGTKSTGGSSGASGRANGSSAGSGGAGGRTNGSSAGSGGSSGSSGSGGEAGDDGAGGGENPGGLRSFRLAVIGSSTAAGEGASSTAKGWVSLLAGSLAARVTTDFDVVNLAVGGYATTDLLPDGSSGNIDDAIEREPNLILVALAGSNDLSSGTSTDTFLSRLKTLRQRGNDAGIPVFFLSTAPKDLSTDERETLRDWAEAMKDELFACAVPDRASDYSPCFIDVFAPLANDSLGVDSDYSAGDGIHLNDAGHAVIAKAAAAVVEPYVCSLTACEP